MPDIVSVGECLIELFSDEPVGTASSYNKYYAGDTLGVLTMASRLGSTVGYITRIGDDHFADYLLDSWKGHNVDTALVKRVPGFTGVHFISLLPDGDREFVYYRSGTAATGMVPGDLDAEYIAGARVLHISAICQAISPTARETVLAAAQIARSRNVLVSYDTNLRMSLWTIEEAREAMHAVLPYVDIVFPGHPEETGALTGLDSVPDVIEYFRSKGPTTVAVKCGEAGAWVGNDQGMGKVPAVAPRGVSDTTGAGDSFVGTFLHCTLEGQDAFDSARWGVVAAGLTVGGRGAILSQPARTEVEQHLGSVEVHPVGPQNS